MPKKIMLTVSLLLLLTVTTGCSLFGSKKSSAPAVTTFNFDIATPSETSMSWLVFYPQTQTEGQYNYSFSVSPTSLANSVSTSTLTRLPDRPRPNASQTLSGAGQANLRLRQSEQELARLRSNFAAPPRDLNFSTFAGYTEGQTYTFWKINFVTNQFETVTAVYHDAYSNNQVIVFVDSSITVDPAMVTELLNTFNDANYNKLIATFGTPYNVDGSAPGTGDGKTIFLLTPLPVDGGTLYGYFWGGNELDPALAADNPDLQYSNYTDMVYLNSDVWSGGPTAPDGADQKGLKGTMAHEYQHLLFWSERRRVNSNVDDVWLNEGFSTLAEDFVDGGYLAGAKISLKHVNEWLWYYSYWSLTNWDGYNESYGGSYLFARYLYDQYGETATRAISSDTSGGITAVAKATGLPFTTVFRNFASSIPYAVYPATSYPQVTPPTDPLIGFKSGITLSASDFYCWYGTVGTIGGSGDGALRPWGVEYLRLDGGAPGTQVHVKLTTTTAGNYGAFKMEGFMP